MKRMILWNVMVILYSNNQLFNYKGFQAPSLDPDDGPSNNKADTTNKVDEVDESHPLLKETNLGCTPESKALRRQSR